LTCHDVHIRPDRDQAGLTPDAINLDQAFLADAHHAKGSSWEPAWASVQSPNPGAQQGGRHRNAKLGVKLSTVDLDACRLL
jgi:hypothetical protein